MSVFGMLTIGSLLAALYQKTRHKEVSEGFLAYLLVLLMVQLFYVFLNVLILAMVIAVGFYFIRWRIMGTAAGRVLLVLFLLGNLTYTEFFNGSATFNSYADFRAYQAPLKHDYWLTPPKVTADKQPFDGSQAEVFTLTRAMKIKQQDGKLYYFFIEGFGHPGRWFEYGVPRGQQVL